MQEQSRYAVGIDIGTTMIRCAVGHVDSMSGVLTIIGVGKAPNSGMRKGVIVTLSGPAKSIDDALGEAERMSGYEVNAATFSINGSHILSTPADGMIAVGATEHEISHEDLGRLEEVATVGKVPANRTVLEVIPHTYKLDGQDNIKNPIGMTGTRLEINANVISALSPYIINVEKAAEMATVQTNHIAVAGLAAAKSVLNERQVESGVAMIDLGGATTSVAIFEEGDLQHASVIPMGQINITNDLAICLKIDPEIAEQVKLGYAGLESETPETSILYEKQRYTFSNAEIKEIIEARLEEIFELVQKELKKAGRAGQLPSGVVLTGGGARLKGVMEYAKRQLALAARIGSPQGYTGAMEDADQPEFATAIGLMRLDAEQRPQHGSSRAASSARAGEAMRGAGNVFRNFIKKFKA